MNIRPYGVGLVGSQLRMSLLFATCFACLANPVLAIQESKRLIELPTKTLVGALAAEKENGPPKLKKESAEPKVVLPAAKMAIESPIELLVNESEAEGPANELAVAEMAALLAGKLNSTDDNPKVQPGAVKWHASLDEATIASAVSGKPVLHFQLLGNLDERFT